MEIETTQTKTTAKFIICVVGYGGSGKSSFINEFIGKDVALVKCGTTCTQKITSYEVPKEMFGVPCEIIDTPTLYGSFYRGVKEWDDQTKSVEKQAVDMMADLYIITTPYANLEARTLEAFKGKNVVIVIGHADKISPNDMKYFSDIHYKNIDNSLKKNVLDVVLVHNKCYLECGECQLNTLIRNEYNCWCVNVGQFEGIKSCPSNTGTEPRKFLMIGWNDEFEVNEFNTKLCPKCYKCSERAFIGNSSWKCSNDDCLFYKEWKFAFESYGHEEVREIVRRLIKKKQLNNI